MVQKSISAGVGTATTLSRDGKQEIAAAMYVKGKNFLGAAMLLRQKGGYEYVVLHLMCQGIEITLKAFLLFKDYDVYKPKLKSYGHSLVRLTVKVLSTFRLHHLRSQLKDELANVASIYSRHLLRYGSGLDILIDPTTIASDRIFRRMAAGLRLAERELTRSGVRSVVVQLGKA